MTDLDPTDLDDVIATRTLRELDPAEAMGRLGRLIDAAHDFGRQDGLQKALLLAAELLAQGVNADDEPLVQYFIGNAWAGMRDLRRKANDVTSWTWEQPETRNEILAFRSALTHPRFQSLETLRRCQIATNLGNLMLSIGRFVEALPYYDIALEADPKFGMAVANRGHSLLYYARALYDGGHRAIFARSAADLIRRSLSLQLEPGVEQRLQEDLERALRWAGTDIESLDQAERDKRPRVPPVETAFRRWVLREHLFVNPLNDLGAFGIADQDVLHLPTMTVAATVGSGFQGFYNQLKQEFAAARFLFYQGGVENSQPHFADKNLGLLDTWNDSCFGFHIEIVKFAFRSAYSLLDKVAVFVARYLGVRPLHRVTMRSVWYVGGRRDAGLLPQFTERKNWPMRGLFWLSRDLEESDESFRDALEPDAQAVARLRNTLEHQYARVTDEGESGRTDSPDHVPPDPFGHAVSKKELVAKTLRMLKTARAALIYLALAVHCEERNKEPADPAQAYNGAFPSRP